VDAITTKLLVYENGGGTFCGLCHSDAGQGRSLAQKYITLSTLFEKDSASQAAEKAAQEQKLQELYAEIGKLTTQVAWLKKKSGLEPE